MSELNIRRLWSARWRLGLWTLVGVAAAAAFVVLHQPEYEIAAQLWVERNAAPLADREPVLDRSFMPTQAEIASSPAVVEVAAARVWASDVGRSVERMPLLGVLASLTVEPLIGSNVLSIRFVHEDPEFAKRMVSEIIAEYRSFLLANERTRNRDSLAALAQHQQELAAEEQRLLDRQTEVWNDAALAGIDRDGTINRDLVARLVDDLSLAFARRAQLEQQQGSLAVAEAPAVVDVSTTASVVSRARRAAASLEVLQRAVLEGWAGVENPELVQQALLDARVRRAELAERVGPKHSAMVAIESRIRALETKLDSLVAAVPEMLDRELSGARRREEELQTLYDQELKRVKTLEKAHEEELRLQDALTKVRQEQVKVADQYVQRKLVAESGTQESITVQVEDLLAPSLTSLPLLSSRKVVLALGAGFGMLGGLLSLAVSSAAGRSEED